MYHTLNERVRRIMDERGATRKMIADVTGIDVKIITRLRTDPTYEPRIGTMLKLADYLQVTFDYLMGWDDEVKVVKVVTRRKFFNEKWEEPK